MLDVDNITRRVEAGDHLSTIHPLASLQECAQLMQHLQDNVEQLAKRKAALQSAFDFLRLTKIPEIMDEMGAKSVNLDGIGRVTLTADAYVNVVKDNREELYGWLTDNGFADLITETVNASTLKAWAIRRLKAGEELPPVVNVTPFTRAAITPNRA